jgi:hypothetical protein
VLQEPRAFTGARRKRRSVLAAVAAAALSGASVSGPSASAAVTAAPALALRVLLIGSGSGDPTTAAWESALSGEGVAYTEVTVSGAPGSETMTLPALTSGSTGEFNGVVFADSPLYTFASGQLTALDAYESGYGVRQIDGYVYPGASVGLTVVGSGALPTGSAQLTTAGLAALPELKGPVPIDAGTFGYETTVVPGAPFTPWLENASGQVLLGVYQHPATDATQPDVAELEVSFNYNAAQLQWLVLAPGLINWVTDDAHLGLYRNYFGQDVDDVFIADNEWSQQYQCTPAAIDPTDPLCPESVQGNAADAPPDTQMTAADVAYVADWEKQSGIDLEFAFNGIGACTAPVAADESKAKCSSSTTVGGAGYTDPGQTVDSGYPNDSAFVNALLADQGDFNWITHTWSHMFLGCEIWQPMVVDPATAGSSGSMAPGTYSYEVTAATGYGESEPSAPLTVTVGADGSANLSWPDAADGGGPSLAALESEFSGGSDFWGYDVYREDPGSGGYGLVGQVAENPVGGGANYSFTDTGAQAPGAGPSSSSAYPTATDPGIECSGSGGDDWVPASSSTPDSSIDQEIGLDDAFAKANGLTNFSTSAVVTGEHSGLENPNMPTAFADMGITAFGADGSRQPNPYTIAYPGSSTVANSAPRYPSNIYYNADNWPDEINEYNSLYVSAGDSIGNGRYPAETGRCADTPSTTCLSAPASESGILASESRIMLGHVLADNPRVGYAHQSNLIGPATQTVNGQTSDYGYTLISLINSMLGQYNSWYSAPLSQVTDTTQSQVLGEQAAWAKAQAAGAVTASETGGVITVTDDGAGPVTVPVTAPTGSTVGGAAFGQSYGGTLSGWVTLGAGAGMVVTTPASFTALAFTSAATVTGSMLAALKFTVTTSGNPTATVTESGTLPTGVKFTAGANGTATISGTPMVPGSTKITLTAQSADGTVTQAFTIKVNLLVNLAQPVGPAASSSAVPAVSPSASASAPSPSRTGSAGPTPPLTGKAAVAPTATVPEAPPIRRH